MTNEKNSNITFSKNSRDVNKFHSSSIASRVEDIHDVFIDPNVKMVITCLGGFNAKQLLRHLDYDLIAKHNVICAASVMQEWHFPAG